MKTFQVVAGVCVIVFLAAFALLLIPKGSHAPRGSALTVAPEIGHLAPDFNLPSVNGSHLRLHDYLGKVVLVNFWASWCGPCRREMPALARSYRALSGKGLAVLGIDKQEPASDVRPFIHDMGTTYPVALDNDGTVAQRYRISPLPVTFVIDRKGVVRDINYGGVDEQYVQRWLDRLTDRA